MAKVEIDESELSGYQRALGLLQKLNASPKARKHLERAVKEEYPDVRTQEEEAADLARPHVERIEALEKTLRERLDADDERRKKEANDAADYDLWSRFQALKKQGYTDDGLEKIAGYMRDRSIADPEAAAALYDRLNPKPVEPAPSSWEPARWDIQHNAVADTKALFENPDRWADQEVGKVLSEIRSQQHAA